MNRTVEQANTGHATLMGYIVGFGISLVTTLGAFWAALTLGSAALPAIIIAALAQLAAQLAFFLHMASGPRSWKITGLFTLVIVGIMMGGTLWIMHNLSRLHHHHEETLDDLYVNGVVAPANELK
jgi:cytochrome o ubiquinol oxidase operon protein cyoD